LKFFGKTNLACHLQKFRVELLDVFIQTVCCVIYLNFSGLVGVVSQAQTDTQSTETTNKGAGTANKRNSK